MSKHKRLSEKVGEYLLTHDWAFVLLWVGTWCSIAALAWVFND